MKIAAVLMCKISVVRNGVILVVEYVVALTQKHVIKERIAFVAVSV